MKTVRFYHLSKTPIEKVLPKLLEKVLEGGKRALVLAEESHKKTMDDSLWTYHPAGFLPHGTSQDEGTKSALNPDPMRYPIWITSKLENPNASTYLLVAKGANMPSVPDLDVEQSLEALTHIFYLFDESKKGEQEAARLVWKSAETLENVSREYWKQKSDGTWEKQDL